jgi:hypothetical protein
MVTKPCQFRLPEDTIARLDHMIAVARLVGLHYPANRTQAVVAAVDEATGGSKAEPKPRTRKAERS